MARAVEMLERRRRRLMEMLNSLFDRSCDGGMMVETSSIDR
jgi:hypothetical protein